MLIGQAVKDLLEPYLGPMVADTCVRGTAITLGKSFDTIDTTDVEAVAASVRRYLAGVATPAVINSVVDSLEGMSE